MPKLLKITLKVLLILFCVLLVLWIALAIYINYNKKAFITTVVKQLNQRLNGDLIIGSMDIDAWNSFPGMSVSLKNVALRDSLWHTHKHDLLKAEYLYADLSLTTLFKANPVISQLTAKNGSIYLYSDKNGYSNTSVFRKNITEKPRKGKMPEFENVRLVNIRFTIRNVPKFKYFVIDLRNIQAHWSYVLNTWNAEIKTDAFIRQFCFNLTRGSFLQNKSLKGNVKLHFDEASRQLTVPDQTVYIDNDAVQLKGLFDFAATPARFQLNIAANTIQMQHVSALLTQSISKTTKLFDLEHPLAVRAVLIGKFKFRDTPWVRAYWTVKNNTLMTPVGNIKNISFTGYYTNQVQRFGTYGDLNSAVNVYNMKGEWNGIPYFADSAAVTNLIKPVLDGRIRSSFPITKINNFTNGNTFSFTAGKLNINLLFKVGLSKTDTAVPYLYGTVALTDAGIVYTPRNLALKNTSGILKFTGSDLSFVDIHVNTAKSKLQMNGSIRDFLTLYYRSPEKALIDWHIKSPAIDLSDFIAYTAAARYTQPANANNPRINNLLTRLNRLLKEGSAHLDVDLDKLTFRRFQANAVKADVMLAGADVLLNNIKLNHADGTLQLKGDIRPGKTATPFSLNANMSHVSVQPLFYSFENFGQDAITDQNIRGSLTAEANIKGTLRNNGEIAPYSLNGEASFHLTDGALKDFDPFKRIGKILFRRRDISNITFKKIENTLLIRGNKIVIKPMSIESNVVNVFLKGVYGLDTGTNIDIEMPLRNPEKDELLVEGEYKETRKHKGLTIHLKATDGDDGRVKIKWVPFKGKTIDPDTSTVQLR